MALSALLTGYLAARYGFRPVPFSLGVGYVALGLVLSALSDWLGRKWMIAGGMWVQAGGLALMVVGRSTALFVFSAVLLGLGTALVYPMLLAAIGDVAHPPWRSSAVGVYRVWRDGGYAAGAVVAGVTADAL